MIHGRIETTSSEQLLALRKARDHYAALAEQLRDETDPPRESVEDLARECDARRIANAYEKSIANMTAKMTRMEEAPDHAPLVDALGVARPAFAALVGGAALVALAFSGIFSIGTLHSASHLAAPPMGTAAVQAIARQAPSAPNASRTVPQLPGLAAAAKPSTSTRAGALRPAPATVQAHSQNRLSRAAKRSPGMTTRAEGGFVAKVLQPDGSLKDVFFSAPR